MRLLYAAAIDNAISPGGCAEIRGVRRASREILEYSNVEKGNTVERHTQM